MFATSGFFAAIASYLHASLQFIIREKASQIMDILRVFHYTNLVVIVPNCPWYDGSVVPWFCPPFPVRAPLGYPFPPPPPPLLMLLLLGAYLQEHNWLKEQWAEVWLSSSGVQ